MKKQSEVKVRIYWALGICLLIWMIFLQIRMDLKYTSYAKKNNCTWQIVEDGELGKEICK